MTGKDRVHKHRVKLYEQQRQRLEICVSMRILDQIRQMTNKPMSHFVRDALVWHIEERCQLISDGKRLKAERERLESLLAEGRGASLKSQVDEYNRQITAFN